MPHRHEQTLLAACLLSAAPLALAHGMEGVVQPLVIAAVAVGLLGGIVTGAMGAHLGGGLLSSIGVLLAAVVIFLFVEISGSSTDFLGIMGMMLILVAFAGAIPLAITFFVAFAGTRVIRARIWPEQKKSEPAP